MVQDAEVLLWNRRIGRVHAEGHGIATFMYDPEFVGAGIEPSPFVMRVGPKPFSFPDLAEESFHGLPGLLSDSVPDKFGNAIIDTWLKKQGRDPGSFTAIERLCYTGSRGMGALEYRPAIGEETKKADRIEVSELVTLASQILNSRRQGFANIADIDTDLASILKIGTSAGGARAKVLVAWNEKTGELRSGQIKAPKGYGYWLLKLDGVNANGDKEDDDKCGYGRIEYAFHLMAKAAGIEMNDCRLFDDGKRAHFITRRFDRDAEGEKLHMLTLGALAHFDFNRAGEHSYEEALGIVETLTRNRSQVEELYRRALFNIFAMNCDDHVKNIAFLMDKAGEWTLAPAYDMAFAYNPNGAWTSRHQMTFNGKRWDFNEEDFAAVGRSACLTKLKIRRALEQVRAAVARWPEFAAAAGVEDKATSQIARLLKVRA